ncbi:hypothetical protein HFX_1835 [Haloferax mediterranei ATCC 33500]|uniref:Uncharacterized protein n=1 Tax=Haloferax mediterranei (strain ATCC 33500 / DSM 1411 / JCM 8866 / NBRC 14739 / NCIMB 2177 / R-4) TaxID=523841 RepID=I3R5M2_HALMT|nr:hypothetical protein HFX_1835 [Haloferax mediterranei ATCC 33500]
MSVVFPAPLGPTINTISPSVLPNSTVTSSVARTLPNDFWRESARSILPHPQRGPYVANPLPDRPDEASQPVRDPHCDNCRVFSEISTRTGQQTTRPKRPDESTRESEDDDEQRESSECVEVGGHVASNVLQEHENDTTHERAQ